MLHQATYGYVKCEACGRKFESVGGFIDHLPAGEDKCPEKAEEPN